MASRSTDVRGRALELVPRASAEPRRREADGPVRERMPSISSLRDARLELALEAGLGKRARCGAVSMTGRLELRLRVLGVDSERALERPPGIALRMGEGLERVVSGVEEALDGEDLGIEGVLALDRLGDEGW